MIWDFLLNKLEGGKSIAMMCVLHSNGSSPGRQGFKMAVTADGEMYGSIGGGIMEFKLVELAKNRLAEKNYSSEIFLQTHDKQAPHQSGMICSGEQTIFLFFLSQKDLDEIKKIQIAFKNNTGETLIITKAGMSVEQSFMQQSFTVEEGEKDFVYREKTGKKHTLHIIGGGHCALALSKLMSEMDFVIKVYEERKGLNTLEQNVYADAKIILTDYNQLNEKLGDGTKDDFVIIMTFGYRTDDVALRAIVGRYYRYLGVLGSKTKIKKMLDQYRAEHFDENWLQSLHAPAGVFIKSETPEEIAVSIAGEIIFKKNTNQ